MWDTLAMSVKIVWQAKGMRSKLGAIRYVIQGGRKYVSRRWPRVGRLLTPGVAQDAPHHQATSDLEQPVNFYRIELLNYKLASIPARTVSNRKPTLNFLFPTLQPSLIFGGYIAALNFILNLTERGLRFRVVVTEPTIRSVEALRKASANNALLRRVLETTEIHLITNRSATLRCHREDRFVGYSWDTMRLAHDLARDVNGSLPIFFIQEYEPVFYPHDSIHFLASSTYDLDHFAIFNSSILRDFFRDQNMGAFRNGDGEDRHAWFSHAITQIRPPTLDALRQRKTRRVLVYARPEAHAQRNLFEIAMMSLNKAIETGMFGEAWEFVGIGSMAMNGEIPLSEGRKLNMISRMPLEDYQRMVPDFDVGLCLMYAPHPSVPPFEMVSGGLVTVTNQFVNKSQEKMGRITPNLIVARPNILEIAEALGRAARRSSDYAGRIEGASFGQVCDWSDSFNDTFVHRLSLLTAADRPSGVAV